MKSVAFGFNLRYCLSKSCSGWGTGPEDAGVQPDHQADAPRRSESKNGKIVNQTEKKNIFFLLVKCKPAQSFIFFSLRFLALSTHMILF